MRWVGILGSVLVLIVTLNPTIAEPLPQDRPGNYVFDLAGVLNASEADQISERLKAVHEEVGTEVLLFIVNDPKQYDGVDTFRSLSSFAAEIREAWDLTAARDELGFVDHMLSSDHEGALIIAVVSVNDPNVLLHWPTLTRRSSFTHTLSRIEENGFWPDLEDGNIKASVMQGTAYLKEALSEKWYIRSLKNTAFNTFGFLLLAVFVAVPIGLLYGLYRLYRRIFRGPSDAPDDQNTQA